MNRSGGGALVLALLVAVWAGSGGMRSGEPTPTLGGNPRRNKLRSPHNLKPRNNLPISSAEQVTYTPTDLMMRAIYSPLRSRKLLLPLSPRMTRLD